jgi:hypothetical protein
LNAVRERCRDLIADKEASAKSAVKVVQELVRIQEDNTIAMPHLKEQMTSEFGQTLKLLQERVISYIMLSCRVFKHFDFLDDLKWHWMP